MGCSQGVRTAGMDGAAGAAVVERRSGYDRRTTSARSFVQGGLTPRRRSGGRRSGDEHWLVDWYEPHLLFLAVAILLLSVTDAFLTLVLIGQGAYEANPVMHLLLERAPRLFAAAKMTLTGVGVLVLVACARAKVFRVVRVSALMHWFLLLYAGVIGYECWLLRQLA